MYKYRLILILALAAGWLRAENPYNFQFRKYQVNDGLSENTVNCIMQDRQGYIWLGTKDGLNKFDGTQFTVYRKQNNEHSIQNNYVYWMTEGQDNQLYIATDDGVYIMDRTDNSFTRLEKVLNANGRIMTTVNHVMLDRHDRLWISCMYDGLYLYDTRKMELKRIPCAGYDLTKTNVWTTLEDQSGTIWVGTRVGLLQYNSTQDLLEPVQDLTSLENSSEMEIMTIFEDPKGNLWLGSWQNGIIFYNKQRKGYSSFCGPKDKNFYITHIRSFLQYSDHEMLVGADDGLYMFDIDSKETTRIDVPGDRYSLGDQNVRHLLCDREGGIWVGTYFGGLNYLSPNIQHIETYLPDGHEGSLSGKAISQFCEAPDGRLWIATEDGGVNLFDPRTQIFSQPVKTSYHNTHPLLLVGDELWIGTFSRGIDIYNTRTRQYRHHRHDPANPHSLNDNCVFSLHQAADGRIYVGTTMGLNRYDASTGQFERIRPDSIAFVYDIKEDAYNNLWIASYSQGAIKYSPDNGKWTFYSHTLDPADPIVGSKLTGIYIDNLKRLWLSSEGRGIFLYHYETDRFTNLSEKDGLPNDVVYGILDDQYGNLWVSSNAGLASFDPDSLPGSLKRYTQDDGLQSNEFNYKSSFKSSDGKFYFGGINGFNAFYPQELNTNVNTVVPPVQITDMRILDNPDKNLDKYILRCINTGEPIRLTHKNSSFTISYTCLSYIAQTKNQYAYMLEGIDQNWKLVGNNKRVTYVNLSPGKYTFRVKASNNNGIWNEEGATLHFEITPPLWLSLPAKTAYAVLTLALIVGMAHRFKRQTAKKQRQQLEAYKTMQESMAFKSKIDFFTNIAHEIRTPVSLIKAPLEEIILSGDGNSNTRHNLSIIEKNSKRLNQLINQLLDFRKMDSNKYIINAGKVDLVKHFSELYERFHKTAQIQNIDFQLVLPKEKSIEIVSDADALTKIVGNFLTNALKYTKDRITLQLRTQRDGSYAVSVTDNGRGIPDESKAHLFDPFYQVRSYDNAKGTGIGLSLAKHLADILEGDIHIDDNPTGGSVFTFTFRSLPEEAYGSDLQPAEPILRDETDKSLQSNGMRHILVVEDNPDMLNFIRESLKKDYKVDTAENAETALERMNSTPYDLIITDIMMPGTDGLELTRRIRADVNHSHIPIILLSAKTDNSTQIEGLNAGADVFMEKPFSPSLLKAQITSLLANRKAIIDAFNKSPLASYSILTSNKSDMEFLNRLNEEIDKNISNSDFSIESLTDKLFISRSNLQRKLKSICGFTPGDYLRTYRLKKAAQLLLEDGLRINEVSYEVGFSSPSYFTKCFVKQFGMLPKDFVKQNNGEADS